MLLTSLLGLIIGSILGLTGAGGGILAVPALVVGLGFSMAEATPVALVSVGLASMLGAIEGLRRKTVRYKAALLMSAVGALTAPLGIWAAGRIPNVWLLTMFSGVMLIVGARMALQAYRTDAHTDDTLPDGKVCIQSPETGRFVWSSATALTLGAIGAVSGLFTGMLGVGGGFIIVPALRHFSNVAMNGVVATSLMVIALISTATVAGAFAGGLTLSSTSWLFIGTTVTGMLLGRLVAPRIPARALQWGFSMICVVVAMIVLAKARGVL
jgi:uncharacterized membrane protein YfcA